RCPGASRQLRRSSPADNNIPVGRCRQLQYGQKKRALTRSKLLTAFHSPGFFLPVRIALNRRVLVTFLLVFLAIAEASEQYKKEQSNQNGCNIQANVQQPAGNRKIRRKHSGHQYRKLANYD